MRPYVIILAATGQEASKYARRADLPAGRWRHATNATAISGLRKAELHELPSYARRADRHAIEAVLRYGKHERIKVTMPQRTDGATEQVDLFSTEPSGYDGFGAPISDAYPLPFVPPTPFFDAAVIIHKVAQSERDVADAVAWETEVMAPQRAAVGEALDRVSIMQAMSDEAGDDDEQFCPKCFAGLESSEHHEKCVVPLEAGDDDPVAPIKKAKRRSKCKVCGELTLGAEDPAHDGAKHDASQVTDRPAPRLVAQDMASTAVFD